MKNENTTILIKKETRKRLGNYGTKGMTYDELLNYLMDKIDKEVETDDE